MMLGIVLNKGDAYNWTNIDEKCRVGVRSDYVASNQARINDLAILKEFINNDPEKKIIYEQLLGRYRHQNNNLVDQKTTKY
jgi:hypothetical protein